MLIDVRKVTGREPTMADRYDLAVHIADCSTAREPRIRLHCSATNR